MFIPDINSLKPAQLREVVIKKNYIEFYEYLCNNFDSSLTFSEKLYWYYNKLTELPICPVCGKTTIFENVKKGYRKYCSKACANKDIEKIEYTKAICIKKYGGIAPICSDIVKTKMNNTMFERYGVLNCQQNAEIKNKTNATIIKRYGGVGNASDVLKTKYINTCIEKYNESNSSKNEIIKEKISKSRRQQTLNNHEHIIDYIDDGNGNVLCKCKCPYTDCNKCIEKYYMIDPVILANRIYHNIELCTNLLPKNSNISSSEIRITTLLDNYNIEYDTNVRNI